MALTFFGGGAPVGGKVPNLLHDLRDRIGGAVGLDWRADPEGHALDHLRHAGADPVGPALGFAQIHVQAREEAAAQHLVARLKGQEVVSALGLKDLTG